MPEEDLLQSKPSPKEDVVEGTPAKEVKKRTSSKSKDPSKKRHSKTRSDTSWLKDESKKRQSKSRDSPRKRSSKLDADGKPVESKRHSSKSKRHSSKGDSEGTNAESKRRSSKQKDSSKRSSSTSGEPSNRKSRTRSSKRHSQSGKAHKSEDSPKKHSSRTEKRSSSKPSKNLSSKKEDDVKEKSANEASKTVIPKSSTEKFTEQQDVKTNDSKHTKQNPTEDWESLLGKSVENDAKKSNNKGKDWDSVLGKPAERDGKQSDNKEAATLAHQESQTKGDSRPTPALGLLMGGLFKNDLGKEDSKPIPKTSPLPAKQDPQKEIRPQTASLGRILMGALSKKDLSKEEDSPPTPKTPPPEMQDPKQENSIQASPPKQTASLGMLEIFFGGSIEKALTVTAPIDSPISVEDGLMKSDDNIMEPPKTPILESPRSCSASDKGLEKKHSKDRTVKTAMIETTSDSSMDDTLNTTIDSESQEKLLGGTKKDKKAAAAALKKKLVHSAYKQLFCVLCSLIFVIGGLSVWYFWDDVLELFGGNKVEAAALIESPAPSISTSPSVAPSLSLMPSDLPSMVPSSNPSISDMPTRLPSQGPSVSMLPSISPSVSFAPSESFAPTGSLAPSSSPSMVPSGEPSLSQNPTWTRISSNWDFKVRLQWQSSYFWQEEKTERFWCLECVKCDEYGRGDGWEHGCRAYGSGSNNNCRNGDSLWIRDCRSRGNRFNVLQIDQKSFMLRLDNTNLCIERRNKHLMFRPCDENDMDQQFVPWYDWNKFELRPLAMESWGEREADCVSQLHHPKQDEVVGMHNCRLSRIYETRHWERYG
ncbi:MAG: hypothetical protein SGBAC_008205 [Bacillariaceae sp.]